MRAGRPLSEVARAVTVPDSISSELIAQRPDILRAQLEVNAAEAKAGAARAARLPRFLLTGQYGTQGAEPSEMFKSSTEVYTHSGRHLDPALHRWAGHQRARRGVGAK